MSRIVISQNDIPTFLLPAGSTEGDARAICLKMRDTHPINVKQKEECPWARWPAITFDWTVIEDYTP